MFIHFIESTFYSSIVVILVWLFSLAVIYKRRNESGFTIMFFLFTFMLSSFMIATSIEYLIGLEQ